MSLFRFIILAALLFFAPAGLQAADPAAEAAHQVAAGAAHATDHAAGAGEHHGLPLYATKVFSIGPIHVTNSMVITWIVALLLIITSRMAMANPKLIPTGAQNFWEWLVEGLYGFLEGIIGYDLAKKTFWFFATLFILILSCNWFGLIPGVGSIGWGTPGADGKLHHIAEPLLRGANADLNMTLAMSMVFFVMWTIWALQANGPGGFLLHIFGPKGDTKGAIKILMIGVFMAVGVLEVVSIIFRPVSLSFRLFGNIFAGENMLETMATLVPALGWLIPIPFYFLELLVGMVQALVFMLLTAVFTLLICSHDDAEHGAHGHEH